MESMPAIIRALDDSGEPVTLESLHAAYAKGAMAALGRRVGERNPGSPHLQILRDLEASGQALGPQAYAGLRFRLGALMQGRFGELCRRTPALDWGTALASPSIVYIELSAMG